jgi:hypothetical protein
VDSNGNPALTSHYFPWSHRTDEYSNPRAAGGSREVSSRLVKIDLDRDTGVVKGDTALVARVSKPRLVAIRPAIFRNYRHLCSVLGRKDAKDAKFALRRLRSSGLPGRARSIESTGWNPHACCSARKRASTWHPCTPSPEGTQIAACARAQRRWIEKTLGWVFEASVHLSLG